MLLKPGKPPDSPDLYRPISLLPTLSKMFEKLICKRLLSTLAKLNIIPDHQIGFCAKHATIEQVHCATTTIRNALEAKEFCLAVFLDVSQAFDRVWIDGLLHKISEYLPIQHVKLLQSYLSDRTFQVQYGEATSITCTISAGVPQGSVLGLLLYTLYTADIPQKKGTTLATFAQLSYQQIRTIVLQINDSRRQWTR